MLGRQLKNGGIDGTSTGSDGRHLSGRSYRLRGTVLVDFWAEWCAPCKMIAPIVDALADEYDGKVKFAKMDVDSNPRTPMTYGIRGIPTLLIFSGGSPVDQVVGAVPKAALKGRIEKAIA